MRWGVPWFLCVAFLVNLRLVGTSWVYCVTLTVLSGLFLSPLALRRVPPLRNIAVIRLAGFFVEANVAILQASIQLLRGQTMLTWEPSKR